jgi:hypothetical protein
MRASKEGKNDYFVARRRSPVEGISCFKRGVASQYARNDMVAKKVDAFPLAGRRLGDFVRGWNSAFEPRQAGR